MLTEGSVDSGDCTLIFSCEKLRVIDFQHEVSCPSAVSLEVLGCREPCRNDAVFGKNPSHLYLPNACRVCKSMYSIGNQACP
ncbi:hypothetical protein D3C87_1563610 [compost metagenome]